MSWSMRMVSTLGTVMDDADDVADTTDSNMRYGMLTPGSRRGTDV